MIRPANLNFIDAEYQGVLFGLYAWPDFNNAQQCRSPPLDQSGFQLPGREFYLNDDAKSKQIREQYVDSCRTPARTERRSQGSGRS